MNKKGKDSFSVYNRIGKANKKKVNCFMDNCITKFPDLGNFFVEKIKNLFNDIVTYVAVENKERAYPH